MASTEEKLIRELLAQVRCRLPCHRTLVLMLPPDEQEVCVGSDLEQADAEALLITAFSKLLGEETVPALERCIEALRNEPEPMPQSPARAH